MTKFYKVYNLPGIYILEVNGKNLVEISAANFSDFVCQLYCLTDNIPILIGPEVEEITIKILKEEANK